MLIKKFKSHYLNYQIFFIANSTKKKMLRFVPSLWIDSSENQWFYYQYVHIFLKTIIANFIIYYHYLAFSTSDSRLLIAKFVWSTHIASRYTLFIGLHNFALARHRWRINRIRNRPPTTNRPAESIKCVGVLQWIFFFQTY